MRNGQIVRDGEAYCVFMGAAIAWTLYSIGYQAARREFQVVDADKVAPCEGCGDTEAPLADENDEYAVPDNSPERAESVEAE